MSKWSAIHSYVHVSSGDGFHWIRIPHVSWMPRGEKNPFVEMLGIKTDKKLSPDSAMRIYMCRYMNSTFCIGHESNGTGGLMFVIGVRSEKDVFQLKLRFSNAEETKIWSYGTTFYVRVLEGDTFSEDSTLKNDRVIGEAIQ